MKYLALAILVLNFSAFAQTETERLIKNSREFMRLDQVPEAIEELSKAISLEPNNPNLILMRAEIFYGSAQKEKAVSDLLRAADLAPEDGEVVLKSIVLLDYFEECSASVRILDRFIAKNSRSAEHFFRRAFSRTCIDDHFGASEDLAAAVELAPHMVSYRAEYIRQLANLGESPRALESLSKMIRVLEKKNADSKPSIPNSGLRQDLSTLYRTRALLFHAVGDSEKEFSDLARYVEYEPAFYNYQNRARIYIEHKMYAEAVNDFTEAIRRTTDHPPIGSLVERAEVYVLAEKYAEAIADYEAALKLEGARQTLLEQRLSEIRKMRDTNESPNNF